LLETAVAREGPEDAVAIVVKLLRSKASGNPKGQQKEEAEKHCKHVESSLFE